MVFSNKNFLLLYIIERETITQISPTVLIYYINILTYIYMHLLIFDTFHCMVQFSSYCLPSVFLKMTKLEPYKLLSTIGSVKGSW